MRKKFGLHKLQDALREAQGPNGLTIDEAGDIIEATGSFCYPSGTTLEMVLEDMQRCGLLKLEGERVYA